jgi:hypothetical protein
MAGPTQSHAAKQPVYEVRESMKHHRGLDLGLRQTTKMFLDAIDFALEFLDEHDPDREGRVSALEVLRVSADGSETVWRYEHDGSAGGLQDPQKIWGFDVTAWRGPERAASRA